MILLCSIPLTWVISKFKLILEFWFPFNPICYPLLLFACVWASSLEFVIQKLCTETSQFLYRWRTGTAAAVHQIFVWSLSCRIWLVWWVQASYKTFSWLLHVLGWRKRDWELCWSKQGYCRDCKFCFAYFAPNGEAYLQGYKRMFPVSWLHKLCWRHHSWDSSHITPDTVAAANIQFVITDIRIGKRGNSGSV